MGIFGGKNQPPQEKTALPGRGAGAPLSLSIVGAGMVVRGDLETDSVVKIEGTVEGHVRAKTQVLVAKGGVVHGDIETTEVIVGGRVNGAIRARARVEVQTGASIDGDVTTLRIAVAEGGSLNGHVKMGDGSPLQDGRRDAPGSGSPRPAAASAP
ncbi:MAG TPA: polymer-forming cytoskeletal protein [Candidatus Methylomirabilis sp.]|nr:polymer-forming cytoskeletal protein [Candidatus Methylomirabilis sp.]